MNFQRSVWFLAAGCVVASMVVSADEVETKAPEPAEASPVGETAAISAGPVIPFQGLLTDSSDVPVTGVRSMTFVLYADPDTPSPLFGWGETHGDVQVINGRFNVLLGSISSFDSVGVSFAQPVYLGITVAEENEMRPRKQIVPAVHAYQATNAEHAVTADVASLGGGMPGQVVAWAGLVENIPVGWKLCDGDAISRTVYVDLFNAIQTSWGGGDGSTTFNLPDLRGQFLRGVDHGLGIDAEAHLRYEKPGGNAGDRVGSYQPHGTAIPTTSPFRAAAAGSEHIHRLRIIGLTRWIGGDRSFPWGNSASSPDWEGPTTLSGEHEHTIVGGDTETRPVNAYVNYIIKY